MTASKRFRVYKVGDSIQLHGIINDTVNLHVLDEMLGEENKFDCAGIDSISWNGLIQLDKYWAKLKAPVLLQKVPFLLLRYLRLLPDAGERYRLENVEISLIYADPKQASLQYQFFSSDKLNQLAEQDAAAFKWIDKSLMIFGKFQCLHFPSFALKAMQAAYPSNPWIKANFDQFEFWYDYSSFAETTLALALDLVQTQDSSLQSLLKEIDLGLGSIEQSLSSLTPKISSKSASILSEISKLVHESCEQLSKIIELSSLEATSILRRFQILAESNRDNPEADMFALMQDFATAIDQLKPAMASIEEIGASTGQQIAFLAKISGYREVVLGLVADSISPEILESVRDTLNIIDPLSEGSWDGTREEILQLLQNVDQSLSKIIILLQGFDLLRQILEHRMHEFGFVKNFLSAPSKDWQATKIEVMAGVSKSLVTDQEKYSCQFFIPEAARAEENNNKPGDMLLF